MLASLKAFAERLAGSRGPSDGDTPQAVQLATAALLAEMARMDAQTSEAERAAIAAALDERFALPADEIAALVALAAEEARRAPGYHPFTALINRQLDPAAKLEVVEMLWRIAFADGRLDDHEHHFVRKIAELLYVPHADFIAAKLRARDDPGAAR